MDLQTFSVMLFHYDNQVDAWSDQPWHDAVVHVRLRVLLLEQMMLIVAPYGAAHRCLQKRKPSGGSRNDSCIRTSLHRTP